MNEQDLLKLKNKLESKRLEKATKEGQLEAEKKKLKEEFGVASAKEAKEKLTVMDGELKVMEEKYDSAIADFKEKYPDIVGE